MQHALVRNDLYKFDQRMNWKALTVGSIILYSCGPLRKLDLKMALPPEYTATMPDGSYFTFFDTGAPVGEPYTTYLLIHGLAYSKCKYYKICPC